MTTAFDTKGAAANADGMSGEGEQLFKTLFAVAREVSELAQLSDRLQGLISAALIADGSATPDHVREFQAIDLLVQRLHGVAVFTEVLAASTPMEWRIDAAAAASAVPLSDLANRLGGLRASESPSDPAHRAPDGDLELFG